MNYKINLVLLFVFITAMSFAQQLKEERGHVTLLKKNGEKAMVNQTNTTDYVGHVTLLRFSQLYLGGGLLMPSSTTKDGANSVNGLDLNIGYYHPIWAWEKSMISLGLNAELGYNLGNGERDTKNQYTIYNLAGQSQLPTVSERGTGSPRSQGFRGVAGLQLNVHLGDKFTLSPILNAGYLSTTHKSFSVEETIYPQGNEFTYTLLAQKESKTSGLGILPKLRMTYNITPRIGIWLEGNYTMGPKIKTEVTTFTPEPSAGVDGTYTLSKFENGKYTTSKRETSYSAVGVNGGIVFSLGKPKESKKPKPTEKQTTQVENNNPTKDNELDITNSNGEIFTTTLIKKDKIDKKNCIKILSPSNASNQNVNENVKILISNEGIKQSEVDIKIYKISNDKNFWNKPENRKDLLDIQNTVFLSGKFEKESEATGFKPISVDAKQSGVVLESNIDKGKLTEGAYRMVVISNCGVTSSNFMVSSSALTTISLTTNCKEKFGDYTYTFAVKNTGTAPINVTSIPSFTSSTGTISGFSLSPTLPIVIIAGGTQTFTGSFTYSGTYTGDVYATVSGHQVGNVNLTSQDTEQGELKSCICDFCNKVLEFDGDNSPTPTYSATNNSLTINQNWWNMNTSVVTVVGAKAEIVSFEREVSDDCMKCDKDSNQWGNFISGSSGTTNGSFGNATGSVTGNTHHTLYFDKPNTYSFTTTISLPPLSTLKCCCEKIRYKIRYTYIFKDQNGDCKMCSAVFEYFYQRGQCPRINPTGGYNQYEMSVDPKNYNNFKN